MKECVKHHWDAIQKAVIEDTPKEELLKVIYESLTDIETDIGLLDEKRKDAEESFSNLLKDFENFMQNVESEIENSPEEDFYIHSNYPIIFSKDNFLSKEECDHIIEISQEHLQAATIYNESNQTNEVSNHRKCKACYFLHNHDEVVANIVKRISQIVNASSNTAEKLQVILYDEEEYFNYHTDSFSLDAINLQDGGQRIFTTMVYLNDVEEGGETHFKLLNLTITPETGKLLVFGNCLKNSNQTNPQTLHAGLPVKKGQKYAINLWFRERENIHF